MAMSLPDRDCHVQRARVIVLHKIIILQKSNRAAALNNPLVPVHNLLPQ